ncbi:MAG: hypothetical protein AAFU41_08335 [Pseudomonadota bacterium]
MTGKWDTKPFTADAPRFGPERKINHVEIERDADANRMYSSTTPETKDGDKAMPRTGLDQAEINAQQRYAGRRAQREIAANDPEQDLLAERYGNTTPKPKPPQGQKGWRTTKGIG